MAVIIDGKDVAKRMRERLAHQADEMKAQGITPGLAVILVGDDPASASYVNSKKKSCDEIGIYSRDIRLPENTEEKELLALIDELNKDTQIDGILVQLPLPSHMDTDKVILAIDPEKDVDGFHPLNFGKLVIGHDTFAPCTPLGVMKLLEDYKIDVKGMDTCVVGASHIVGKPQTVLLLNAGASVDVCHILTRDLKAHTKRADLVIVAAGKANLITGDMIKEGAVVIDVGINRVEDAAKKKGYRITGDVNFKEVEPRASYITPVPGGVGPMTITMLLFNTVKSAKRRLKKD